MADGPGGVTALTAGDEVRVLAPSFPSCTGTVTDSSNGLTYLTVTVRTHHDGREWVFDPTDELELITDDRLEDTATDDAGRARDTVPA